MAGVLILLGIFGLSQHTTPAWGLRADDDRLVGGGSEAIAPRGEVTARGAAPQDDKTVKRSKATFAGGCFWCMEPPFDAIEGVVTTTVGYTGGEEKNPTYKEVAAGKTGHAEAIEIVFEPKKVTYNELLDVFWRNIDPTTANRQFCDWGSQYRTAIFYHDEEQKRLAEQTKKQLEKTARLGKPIVTEIVPASSFYVAEAYHQDYYKKNPTRYKSYRYNCGRDQRLRELWGEEKN